MCSAEYEISSAHKNTNAVRTINIFRAYVVILLENIKMQQLLAL